MMNRCILLTCLCLAVLPACRSERSATTDQSNGSSGTAGQADAIRVIATTGMVADLVRSVGGDRVNVVQLIGSGIDPHLFNASTDDVKMIIGGDVVFYSGLMLEGKLSDTLTKVGRDKPVFAVTELMDPDGLLQPYDGAGHYDPHVWMDVSAWSTCISVVAEKLSEIDPQGASTFQSNGDAYAEKLSFLDEYGKAALATIPADRRILITSHDAFNYFGRAYNLNVQGVQGLSTESEAGLQRINELVDLLVEKNIKAVFIETSVSPRNIRALIEGVEARGAEMKIGGELFSDAMGTAGTYEGTYIGMLDHNITTVARSLGGDAPERGLNGKLSVDEPETP